MKEFVCVCVHEGRRGGQPKKPERERKQKVEEEKKSDEELPSALLLLLGNESVVLDVDARVRDVPASLVERARHLGLSISVLVEDDRLVALVDESAIPVVLEQGDEEVALSVLRLVGQQSGRGQFWRTIQDRTGRTHLVVGSKELLERLGGLPGVVVRNLGRDVVGHVGLADTVQHEGADEAKAISVGSGERSVREGPDVVGVVGEHGVGVLKEGDANEPMVHPQVGGSVVHGDLGERPLPTPDTETDDEEQDTDVRGEDLSVVSLVEDDRGGREVVGELGVMLLARGVPREVPEKQRRRLPRSARSLQNVSFGMSEEEKEGRNRVRTSAIRRAAGREG